MDYQTAFDPLRDVYLEESWVREIRSSTYEIALRLDAVLDTQHPQYLRPRVDEQYCFRTAWMRLSSALAIEINWEASTTQGSVRSLNHGSVDSFSLRDGTQSWVIAGSWGSAQVAEPTLSLEFDVTS